MISFEIEVTTQHGGSCRFRLDALSDTAAVAAPAGRDERGRWDVAGRLSIEARPGEIIHLRFD